MNIRHRVAVLGLAFGIAAAGSLCAAPLQVAPSPAGNASPAAPAHAMPDPQKQTAHLTRKLQLTPDQAAKIEPILANRLQQIQQMRADTSSSPRDMHQKMRALKQSTDEQIQGILTDSQRQQYQQMQQEAMQKHHDHAAGTAGSGG